MSTHSRSPGWRFHPTDAEIMGLYLKKQIRGESIQDNPIVVVDLYSVEPWDLPVEPGGSDQERYFYIARHKKSPKGCRTNRATERGYWKSTGKDRFVQSQYSRGMKKTLVYYIGRAPNGQRTDWVMHEYRMADEVYENLRGEQVPYVLVRVFKKNGPGPNNGARYGGPFIEEPWTPPQDSAKPSSGVLEEAQFEEPGELPGECPDVRGNMSDFLDEESVTPRCASTGDIQSIFHEMPGVGDVGGEDDGITVEDVFGTEQSRVATVNENWREEVINSDVMIDNNVMASLIDLEFDDDDIDLESGLISPHVGSVGDISIDDYLEMDDLIVPNEESIVPESSQIQLLPRSTSTTVQLNPQGDISRRIRLARRQASYSQSVDLSDPAPSAPELPSRSFHRSSSSSAFAEFFAEDATPILDQHGPSQELFIDSGLVDYGALPDPVEGVQLWVSNADQLQSIAQGAQSQSDEPPTIDSRAHDLVAPELTPAASPQAEYSLERLSWRSYLLPSGITTPMRIRPASARSTSEPIIGALKFPCLKLREFSCVEVAAMDCVEGKLHQGVLSGIMKPCIDGNEQQGWVQCSKRHPQRQVVKGSRSGFVFACMLGVVSSLIWFFLMQGSWRIVKLVFSVIL
ncbi:uncharacterized protein [Physcomitrium patens]|uniref:uncharacterized protein isoform X2 n=1 Tax=Physcomitrium patens TaxID=3218 RepID=UPI00024ACBA7|nr:protein NTM1-like 9 isoform X2 [Physcomitrium patens]|eukprot:XP_024357599.1 protein NTM1-like 9 isoform X2 [Physcomitrella patens]